MASDKDYSATAKSFHWLTLGMLIVQYLIGWLMPEIHPGMSPGFLMDLHMSFGAAIGIVVILRLAWRVAVERPEAISGMPDWQRRAAELVHWLMYGLIFAILLSGWAFASARGWTIDLFGVLPLPPLLADGAILSILGRALGALHGALAALLLIAVGLHAAAALAHHAIWRDRTLQRMLPRRSARGAHAAAGTSAKA